MRLTTVNDQLLMFRRESTNSLSPYATDFPRAKEALTALDQRFSHYNAALSGVNAVESRITAYEASYQQASVDYSRIAVSAPDPAYATLATWSSEKRRLLALREDIDRAIEHTAANDLPPVQSSLNAAEQAIRDLYLAIPAVEYEVLQTIATTQRQLTTDELRRVELLRARIMALTTRPIATPNA